MKSILITGASSGIGLATANLFKKNGYKVFTICRKQEDAQHLKEQGFESFCADVCNYSAIDRIFDTIAIQTTLDIVFNNAGYGQPGAVEDISIEVMKEQFETNFFALHYVTNKAISLMKSQNNSVGKIIQHSSVLGLISLRFRGAYNASKYAIEGLCDTLRLELADTNIKIITLNTGPVKSKFRDNALKMFEKNINKEVSCYKEAYEKELGQRLTSPDDAPFTLSCQDAAQIVLKIAQSSNPKPRYYITHATTLLATFKRLLPTSWLDKILLKIN